MHIRDITFWYYSTAKRAPFIIYCLFCFHCGLLRQMRLLALILPRCLQTTLHGEAFCFWSEETGWFTAAWKGEVCPNDAGHKESIVFPVAIEALFIQFLVFLFVFWVKTDPSKHSTREIKFLSAKVAYLMSVGDWKNQWAIWNAQKCRWFLEIFKWTTGANFSSDYQHLNIVYAECSFLLQHYQHATAFIEFTA